MGYRSFHENGNKNQIFKRHKKEYLKAKTIKEGGRKNIDKDTRRSLRGDENESISFNSLKSLSPRLKLSSKLSMRIRKTL